MLFATLASYFDRLEKTSGRLEMTAILADLLKKSGDDEIRQVCYLSLGRLGPLYESLDFNLASKLMIRILARAYGVSEEKVKKEFGNLGDLGNVAEKLAISHMPKAKSSSLTVNDVFDRLYEIASVSGAGSVEQKVIWMVELLELSDPLSSKYIARIPLGNMRLGFSDKTLIEALSWMERGNKSLKKEIEAVYHVFPDIGEIADRFKGHKGRKGIKAIEGMKMKIGAPVLPALCQRVETPGEMLEKLGGKVVAEPKFDGERIQLHLNRKPDFLIKMFTRNLEEVSAMFPELVAAADGQIKANRAVLDGEAVGVDPKSGKFIPFQQTIQRKRKYGVKEKALEIPIKYFVFDILHKDGRDLLTLPFSERRKILEKTIESKDSKVSKDSEDKITLTPQKIFTDPTGLKKFLDEEVEKGAEGLVVKDLSAPYEAGARGFSWIKYKAEKDTVDAVVLGYYFGRGKRADFGIGAFLIGVYDSSEDRFKTLSKVGTGLTDEQWVDFKVQSSKFKVQNCPKNADVPKELIPDVWVRPEIVVVVKYDEISKSPLHTAGYALRFPRLISYREDKTAQQATTVKEIKKMFGSQS